MTNQDGLETSYFGALDFNLICLISAKNSAVHLDLLYAFLKVLPSDISLFGFILHTFHIVYLTFLWENSLGLIPKMQKSAFDIKSY